MKKKMTLFLATAVFFSGSLFGMYDRQDNIYRFGRHEQPRLGRARSDRTYKDTTVKDLETVCNKMIQAREAAQRGTYDRAMILVTGAVSFLNNNVFKKNRCGDPSKDPGAYKYNMMVQEKIALDPELAEFVNKVEDVEKMVENVQKKGDRFSDEQKAKIFDLALKKMTEFEKQCSAQEIRELQQKRKRFTAEVRMLKKSEELGREEKIEKIGELVSKLDMIQNRLDVLQGE